MSSKFYQKIILQNPKSVFIILILALLSFGYYSKDFRLDASSETLLIEGDPDLEYLKQISDRYGSKEFLILTYTPNENMVSESSINNLLSLKYKIQSLDWVHSVVTLLDVPLLDNSDAPLQERIQNFKTLKDENVDKERGFKEIISSPVFRNFVISEDGKTSGIIVYIKKNAPLKDIDKKSKKKIQEYKDQIKKQNHRNILEIRDVISSYEDIGKIHLGGIPMIADDMMTFIKSDIIVFGLGVFFFIVATLWFVFRKAIWVIVPISSCFFSVIIMMGLLGLLGWKVTVISSNFIALMLILTMAMNIHMSTRFLQLKEKFPSKNVFELISETTKKMFWPILYTVLTTIIAFLSLIFSEIKPIVDFGWMMTLGLTVSLIVTFLLLPSVLSIFSSENELKIKDTEKSLITSLLANVAKKNTLFIFFITFLVIVFSIIGITKLEVENSFINYFDKETEIYKGMKKIDDELGGTTPLNIILNFPTKETSNQDDEFSEWEEDNENKDDKSKYWFTRDKMDKILKVHDYLDSLPEIGKVLSFGSILRVAEDLNKKELQSLEIAVLYSKIPDEIKKEIVSPYISVDKDEARITVRVKDSLETLKRNELINKINLEINTKLGFQKEEYKLTGVLILFNNLLQSLFKSQILTLGLVILGIFAMFMILFRNIKLSLIGIVPNFIAAFFILGIIGLLGIPLDMMTITIAAITIGIAVDNSIHYIYRFKEEFKKIKDYNKTLKTCHSTVGVAILNTSITIVFGFSILVLSKFIPTIYFGVFTGLAMLLAMISVLTLLPALILIIKPFGKSS